MAEAVGDMTSEQQFAALPVRACSDKRLTGGHWRVLRIIAYHDRFNRNNRGCYIKHQKMAEMIGSSRSSVTEWLRDLLAWGYLGTLRPQTSDGRRAAYTVLYDEPSAEPANKECPEPGTLNDNVCPEMGQSMS